MAQDANSNTYYDLSYEKAEQIATITLDNPEKLNAMTARMLESFSRAIEEVRRDDDVRVLVLTGRGRGFCTGADTELLIALAMGSPYPAPSKNRADVTACSRLAGSASK